MAANSIVIQDRVKKVVDSLRNLTKEQVLVGIPAGKAGRQDGQITNAALGYIHEFGAPGANIPARPFLIPGVRKSRNATAPHLRAAALAALKGDKEKSHRELVQAGIIAENAVKQVLTSGEFVPLKPSTVANRYRSRGTATRRPGEEHYMKLIASGATPEAAQAAAGIRPLINTGALRQSITSVVRRAK